MSLRIAKSVRILGNAIRCGIAGALLSAGIWLTGRAASAAELPANASPRTIRFDRDVKPILAHHCFKCHGRGRDKGGLQMDSREQFLRGGDSGAVVRSGLAAESRLLAVVSGRDPELSMPPKEDGNPPPLSSEQIGILRQWINEGLDWTDERIVKPYALALRRVSPPAGDGSPIDRLLAPYFLRHGIEPPAPVDDRRFARRVFLDLVGLLPTPDELEAFARDERPDKRARLVRQLLDDHESFVAQWMPFWMDHLRIGSNLAASIFDNDNSAKPRQWLERQLRAAAPYDQFVREMIGGPFIDDFAQSIAPSTEVANAQGRPEMQVAHVLSQTLLGVRLQCASCHDSFVDRWTLREAWSFASALGGESFEMSRCEIPTGAKAPPAFLFPELGGIDESRPASERRARLAELMTSPANGLFARTLVNRIWARLFGRGLVEPLDEMVEHEAWHPDLLDWLAGEFVREKYDLKRLLARIITSRAYQLPAHGTVGERGRPARNPASAGEPRPSPEASAFAEPTADKTADRRPAPPSGPAFVFRGPLLRRLSAEQFVDAVTALASPAGRSQNRAWAAKNDSLMKSLGRPDRNTVATSRTPGHTVLETLEWMNGEQLESMLEPAARNIVTRGFESSHALATNVCLQLLGRPPSVVEGEELTRILRTEPTPASVADFLWALLMLPEFQFIR